MTTGRVCAASWPRWWLPRAVCRFLHVFARSIIGQVAAFSQLSCGIVLDYNGFRPPFWHGSDRGGNLLTVRVRLVKTFRGRWLGKSVVRARIATWFLNHATFRTLNKGISLACGMTTILTTVVPAATTPVSVDSCVSLLVNINGLVR